MATGEVNIKVIDENNFIKYVENLNNITERKVIISALRKAGNAINKEAKSLFQSRKKNKSKTGYTGFNSMFKVQPMRGKDYIAVKVGLTGPDAYKYRWIEWGTNERTYITRNKKEHTTGRIQPTHFFYDAVTSKTEESKRTINQSIIDALKKLQQ